MIKLGVLPVKSLLLVEGALWAASGGQVFMASLETHAIEVSAVKHILLPRAVDRVCPSSTGILQYEWRDRVVHSGAVCERKRLWALLRKIQLTRKFNYLLTSSLGHRCYVFTC